MNKNASVSEGILKSALEIIFLVTGDEYVIVKKKSLHNNVHLLAGEVPVIYDDFAVFFSREEWKFVEGHKDHYKDVVMESMKPFTPFGCTLGSNSACLNGNPTETSKRGANRRNETQIEREQMNLDTSRDRIPAAVQEDDQMSDMDTDGLSRETETSTSEMGAATECLKHKGVRRDSHSWECCRIHCHDVSRTEDANNRSLSSYQMVENDSGTSDERKRETRAQMCSSDQPLEDYTSTAPGLRGELIPQACTLDPTVEGDKSRISQIIGELHSTACSSDHPPPDGTRTMYERGKPNPEACMFSQTEESGNSRFDGDPHTPKYSLDSLAADTFQGIPENPDPKTFMSDQTEVDTDSPCDFKVELLQPACSVDRDVQVDALYKSKTDDSGVIHLLEQSIPNNADVDCESRLGPSASPSSDVNVQGDSNIFCKFPVEPFTRISASDGRAHGDTGKLCKFNVQPCSAFQAVGNGNSPSHVCKESSQSTKTKEDGTFVFSQYQQEDRKGHSPKESFSPSVSAQSEPEIHEGNTNFNHDHCYINSSIEEMREEDSTGLFNQSTFCPARPTRTPHMCHLCGKRFTYKSMLTRHQRTHTGEKSFICNECGNRYVCKFNLVVHQRKHTGEKPYQCKVCSKHFAHKSAFNQHLKRHVKIIKS